MKKIYLGTMGITQEQMKASIKNAVDAGFYGIDTAWRYHNEKEIGRALASLASEGYQNIQVQTKIWPTFFDNPYKVFKKQLQDLQLAAVESVLLHRPPGDFKKAIHAWKELIKLKEAGLTKRIGVSNFDKDMVEILVQATGVVPESNQIELSVTNFRDDRVAYLKARGIEIQGWSPMGKNIHALLSNAVVKKLATKHQVSVGIIAISYLTSQGIVPVLKSTSRDHIFEMQNLITLTDAEISELKACNTYQNKASETYTYGDVLT